MRGMRSNKQLLINKVQQNSINKSNAMRPMFSEASAAATLSAFVRKDRAVYMYKRRPVRTTSIVIAYYLRTTSTLIYELKCDLST